MKLLRNILSLIIGRPIDDNWRVVKKLYHGSCHKIKDDILNVGTAHINGLRTEATAVFATSDFFHAMAYAAMCNIGDGWKIPHSGVGLFLEKMKKNKINTCYIYEVDSRGFRQDFWTDYYRKKPAKINRVIKINIQKEIKSGNLKVYCFNNVDFTGMTSLEKMDHAYKQIRAKKYKRYTG